MNIDPRPQAKTTSEMTKLFHDLEILLWSCGPEASKHDQVKVLISACIDDGIDKGPWIVGTVSSMGFNARHIGKILHDHVNHLWSRDSGGQYTTLPTLN